MSEIKLLPCPFCGSHNIDYSVKTMGLRAKKYHVAMYCKDCNCYGKRAIVDVECDGYYAFRFEVERNPKYKEIAINNWNTRKPMERIISRYNEMMPIQFNGFGKTLITLEDAINVVKEEGGIE